MTTEDRTHRSKKKNPRNHPIGKMEYASTSKWNVRNLRHIALLSEPEMQFMQDIPRHLGDGNYANLGNDLGGSAILLAVGLQEWCNEGRVYSVDLTWRKKGLQFMHNFGVRDLVQKCKGSTSQFAQELSNMSFNFVFIDADHCYDAVVTDFLEWSPMVRVGGWVCFHDTNQEFSHQAIETVLTGNRDWVERPEYHIHSIRTFEKIHGSL